MSDKLIDIIIPAYNAGNTIDKCLMSIAIQNIVDKVNVIIVDDCSDKIHRDLYYKYKSYFKQYFPISIHSLKRNCGPGGARNYGLNLATSMFITFIDADDVFATSTSLFTLYKDIYNNPNVNYSNSVFQEEVKNENGEFVGYYDHKNDMTWMFGKIYRLEFLRKYDIQFNNSRSNEDCGFNTMCMLCTEKNNDSLYIDRLTYCWNYNPASITKNNDYSFYGLKGYLYNNIWAVHEIQDRICNEKYNLNNDVIKNKLKHHIINTMIMSYIYYEKLRKENRSQEQINLYLGWVVDYYRDVYIRYREIISQADFTTCYKQVKANNEYLLSDWVETISVLEFLVQIDKLMKLDSETCDLYDQYNIRYKEFLN
jgi:glycosyltransferase involved in cell wall biosynthesis